MALSNDLLSQFAKETTDKKKIETESTVYGTVVEFNGKNWVRLDGSDMLTPMKTTVEAKPGERVSMLIKNHSATVTGNMSSPGARIGTVEEIEGKTKVYVDTISGQNLDYVNGKFENLEALSGEFADLKSENATFKNTVTERLDATDAKIENLDVENLDARYAKIETLESTNANLNNLSSTYADFKNTTTDKFTAIDANILKLDTDKLSADTADIKYANIDFSNIGKAAIEHFYSTSGIIKDLVVGDTSVTGELVGITIKGDLIEGNTIKADKLVVKGTDGLYYKLNTDGMTTEAEQTEYNSLNGSVITAKSITATKVNVDDLVAFGATIGGFNITENAIYSGTKSTIRNNTNGVYLDKTGQMNVGNGLNYLKFYKEPITGEYVVDISANQIYFGAESKNVEETFNETDTKIDNTADSLSLSIANQSASITNDSRNIVLEALSSYVEKDEFNTFKSDSQASLKVLSDQIEMNFNTSQSSINNVDEKVDQQYAELSKYIRFGTDGIEIGEKENSLKLKLDNNMIQFSKNDTPVGWWDGNDFHTGNIIVEVNERAQFGNFAFLPRSDGSLMLLKVKGE